MLKEHQIESAQCLPYLISQSSALQRYRAASNGKKRKQNNKPIWLSEEILPFLPQNVRLLHLFLQLFGRFIPTQRTVKG